jgi:hypothetical protein
MQNSRQLIIFGQVSLFLFLFICFLLIPHFLLEANEGGVSNYGTYAKTVVPYTLAFALCGLLTIRAAVRLPRHVIHRRYLMKALMLLGVLYFAVLLSTYLYKLNHNLNNLHVLAGTMLAIYSMILSGWFVLVLAPSGKHRIIFLLQSLGFVITILTYFGYIDILFIAELLTSGAFGVLLVETIGQVTTDSS